MVAIAHFYKASGKMVPVIDAFAPHPANISCGTYLFLRSFNRLEAARPKTDRIARTGRGGISASALRTDSRRSRCRRASKHLQLLALFLWLQLVATVTTKKKNQLWSSQSQKNSQWANSKWYFAARAFWPARGFLAPQRGVTPLLLDNLSSATRRPPS